MLFAFEKLFVLIHNSYLFLLIKHTFVQGSFEGFNNGNPYALDIVRSEEIHVEVV